MKYNPQIHHRRSVRLSGYNYSLEGWYFVTVCTHERELILEVPGVACAIRSVWEALPSRFSNVSLDEFVVMPNHVHGIVVIHEPSVIQGAASSAPTLGRVLRAFKSISAISGNRTLNLADRPFWQRNYYERIIRNEKELNAIRQYIRDNPTKWAEDKNNPSNWHNQP